MRWKSRVHLNEVMQRREEMAISVETPEGCGRWLTRGVKGVKWLWQRLQLLEQFFLPFAIHPGGADRHHSHPTKSPRPHGMPLLCSALAPTERNGNKSLSLLRHIILRAHLPQNPRVSLYYTSEKVKERIIGQIPPHTTTTTLGKIMRNGSGSGLVCLQK